MYLGIKLIPLPKSLLLSCCGFYRIPVSAYQKVSKRMNKQVSMVMISQKDFCEVCSI